MEFVLINDGVRLDEFVRISSKMRMELCAKDNIRNG
jgi:hypothetical protein